MEERADLLQQRSCLARECVQLLSFISQLEVRSFWQGFSTELEWMSPFLNITVRYLLMPENHAPFGSTHSLP